MRGKSNRVVITLIVLIVIAVVVLIVVGFSRPVAKPAATQVAATATTLPIKPAATATAVIATAKTAAPTQKPTSVVAEVAIAVKEVASAPRAVCPYRNTGSPQPEKVAIQIAGKDGSKLYAVDLTKLPDCAIIFEGRFPWQIKYLPLSTALSQAQISNADGSPWNPWNVHMIVDIRSDLGAFNPRPMNELVSEIIPDQYLDWFVYSEGSLWEYDPTWNMSNVTTVKPSIGQELEAKKLRDAMKPGNYLFPRVIMQPAGQMFVYYTKDAGDTAYDNGTAAGCTKTKEPEQVPVYGLWNGQGYTAAIGAGSCWMSIWIDGNKTPTVWNGIQKDGDRIVSYMSKVEAWIFPSAWTETKVSAWVSKH